MDILEFQGENRWLSNFWPAAVRLDGDSYPSIEHAYQAAKFCVGPDRLPFLSCTAGQAKRLGRSKPARPEWEYVKVATMRELIAQKYAAGTPLGRRLLSTGDCNIVEGNTWGDVFWGVCGGKGQNLLGVLLMEQRARLREQPNG